VTTSALSTCPPTPSNINAPSILRLISILFGSVLLLWCPCTSCSYSFTVRRHFHQGAAFFCLHRV
jgi:hypothetical protein